MTANKDMKNVEVVWWLSLSIVIWKCACHFTFEIFTDCVENFSILGEKEIFQPNVRFEFSHSLVLKIPFIWTKYSRHLRSGVKEHVSPVFHILQGLLNHSR
jgi:hypothetical protein